MGYRKPPKTLQRNRNRVHRLHPAAARRRVWCLLLGEHDQVPAQASVQEQRQGRSAESSVVSKQVDK